MFLTKIKLIIEVMLKKILSSFCIGSAIFGLIIGLILSPLYKKSEFVYVNMDRVIAAVVEEVGKGGEIKDANIIRKKIMSYREEFGKEIENYSKKHEVIIFSSPKPIAGAVDKTDYFLKKVLVKQTQNNKEK